MKKMKKSSKGFTLTELAIVIAVIAILIAVLVPTFVSLINKANESNDKQLVANLNKSLSTNIDIETPADALDAVAADGYSVDKLKTSSNCEIIYDEAANVFVLLTSGAVSYPSNHSIDLEAATTWYFVSSQSEIAENATVSYFISGDWSTSTASAQTVQTAKYSVKKAAATTTGGTVTYTGTGSIDTSRATGIATVKYSYTGADTDEATVIINVTSGALYIDLSDSKGTVTINNYSSEDVTTAVTGSDTGTDANVTLNNVNSSSCYVEESLSNSVEYSGDTESYNEVASVDVSTGTVEVGSEAYPYLIASEDDLTKKISYGGYYQLTDDVTSATAVTIAANSEVILDLGGYTLTISGYVADYNCALLNNGVLTINNGTLNVFASYTYGGIKNYGTVTVNSDAIVNGYFATIYNKSNVNIYGTVISNQYNNSTSYSYSKAIYNSAGTVNIYEGAYIYGYYGLYNYSTININGGEIGGTYGIYTLSTVNVNGGTISGTYGINSYGGNITISGEAKVNGSYWGVLIGSSSNTTTGVVTYGTLNMTGGTVNGDTYGIYTAGTTTITGGDISSSYMGIMAYGGNLTIGAEDSDNNEITISNNSSSGYIMQMYNGAIVEVYGGKFTSKGYGIAVFGESESVYSYLYVYGGTISASGFAISGNGSATLYHDTNKTQAYNPGYVKIYIYGGTLTSTDAQAIYNPQQQGETYIYGGTISGTSGIEIRNGYVYIGEVKGKTVDSLYIKATYTPSNTEVNNSGSTTAGAAIAISAYNLVDITVEIGTGTYEGYYSLFEYYVNGTTKDSNGNITKVETLADVNGITIYLAVTDGYFNGTVYSQNVTGFISGGSFKVNDNISDGGYLESGYQISETVTGGYYTISEATVTETEDD